MEVLVLALIVSIILLMVVYAWKSNEIGTLNGIIGVLKNEKNRINDDNLTLIKMVQDKTEKIEDLRKEIEEHVKTRDEAEQKTIEIKKSLQEDLELLKAEFEKVIDELKNEKCFNNGLQNRIKELELELQKSKINISVDSSKFENQIIDLKQPFEENSTPKIFDGKPIDASNMKKGNKKVNKTKN